MSGSEHLIAELDRSGLRHFGLTTGAIVAGLFGIFFPWLLNAGFVLWPWLLFALLAVVGLLAPMSLQPVYRGWMRFGLVMSRFTTPLVMGLVFFLVISPVALVIKFTRKDPMKRSLSENLTSYRIETRKPPRENIERPY
jgi:Kef-type K+ transport system membrane component KefB